VTLAKEGVPAAIEKTWGAATRLRSTGWNDCGASVPSTSVPIRLVYGGDCFWGGLASFGVGARLNGIDQIDPNAVPETPYDGQSIMNYCRGTPDLFCANDPSPDLTAWDIYGIQKLYGKRTEAFRQLVTLYKGSTTDSATSTSTQLLRDLGYSLTYPEGLALRQSSPRHGACRPVPSRQSQRLRAGGELRHESHASEWWLRVRAHGGSRVLLRATRHGSAEVLLQRDPDRQLHDCNPGCTTDRRCQRIPVR
jgi:hypothetical protein